MNLLVNELVEEISSSWQFPKDKQAKPILLIMAGFQGSGKTTALKALQKDLGLIITSPDEIRHKLFSRNVPFSDEFVATVNETNEKLIEKALKSGYSLALDHNVTPKRMEVLLKYIKDQNISNYKIVKVLLTAPTEVLAKRLEERPEIVGTYKGKVDELYASVKEHGELNENVYDLIIDTSKNDPDKVVELIKSRVLDTV